MTTSGPGLRERKKQTTRAALREAALRLALERGPGNLRVDDIAQAAGVSTRTYNNYFSSREQAIVAAVAADREARVAAAVAARSPCTGLARAVVEAVVEHYGGASDRAGEADVRILLDLIASHGALREAYLGTAAAMEEPLARAIAEHLGDADACVAPVLSASVAAAVRIALGRWLEATPPSAAAAGLVVVTGALPDLLRTALAPLVPALDAAERRQGTGRDAPERRG